MRDRCFAYAKNEPNDDLRRAVLQAPPMNAYAAKKTERYVSRDEMRQNVLEKQSGEKYRGV